VAGDCNSLAETHAWFDSRVAHHLPPWNDWYFHRERWWHPPVSGL